MPKTPSEMHMYDMVTIDTIVFEIVGGGEDFLKPSRIVSCLKYPGSDRVKQTVNLMSAVYWKHIGSHKF